ncbi:MAG: phosphoribosylformimino-5-aminoimidazole carboxamide ribotide [Planctomycetota bacterium]|nr:MAG: phosphoribosylformimino-5-aminoimidazole carboxamide ribotide [Planctomycetota bacterium]
MSHFVLIPAVDIRGGKAVRMVGGEASTEKTVGDDPVALAKDWEKRGAKMIHVVDLDAAFGTGSNRDVVKKLVKAVGVPVQFGGGVRTDEAIGEAVKIGAARIVCGTRAVTDPEWLMAAAMRRPGRLVLAADARGLDLVVKGWTAPAGTDVLQLLAQLKNAPLAAVLYTNVNVEGRTAGVDWKPVKKVVAASVHPLILSGGVTTVDDVKRARDAGLAGAVVGSALYFGKLNFEEALRAVQEASA